MARPTAIGDVRRDEDVGELRAEVRLSDFTTARVGLGQAGDSLPTAALLAFQLAHARARDAVHASMDSLSLIAELRELGLDAFTLTSQAANRQEYLLRPDLGRRLSAASETTLLRHPKPCKTIFAIADGLSALAVHRNAVPVLGALQASGEEMARVLLLEQARVGISDHIGELLDAEVCVLLIGERPGLSAADSLGMYLTWRPRLGCTDANRNCVSNVHAQGLSYEGAARKIAYLLAESRRLKLSGVGLKERSEQLTDGYTNRPSPGSNPVNSQSIAARNSDS